MKNSGKAFTSRKSTEKSFSDGIRVSLIVGLKRMEVLFTANFTFENKV